MANKKYHIELSQSERLELDRIRKSNAALWKRKRAECLLKLDRGEFGPGWIDERVSEAFEVTTRSLENWRKQSAADGPLSLMERKLQTKPRVSRKLDGAGEARVVALACSSAPEGRSRWSLRLLAEKVVELKLVDTISHQTIARVLKKRMSAVA